MGQISLPRLEKINTTMTWESSFFSQDEQWASPKLLIMNKLFASLILKKKFSLKKKWNTNTLNIKNFFLSKGGVFKSYRYVYLYTSPSPDSLILGVYIYQFNNKYTTIAVYSSRRYKNNFFDKLKVLPVNDNKFWFNLTQYLTI